MTTIPSCAHGIDIHLAQPRARVDQPVGLQVTGLESGAHVIVTAAIDYGNSTFVSDARFHADDQGRVDTAVHASHAGTYLGIDPFGLWWSGEVAGSVKPAPLLAQFVARVRVESGSRKAEANIERPWLRDGVTLTSINSDGVHGLFARPAGAGPFPCVVAFGGSSGGLGPSAGWAASLASRGFAVLAISYFGIEGLSPELTCIEVEVVQRAVDWLFRRTDVKRRVGVMGISRGSELAMLAGVLLDHVDAVVASAPSGVVWSGLGQHGPIDRPAWTFRGEAVPYATTPGRSVGDDPTKSLALRSLFDKALEQHAMIEAAEIPVEQLRGPLLLVSGGADEMWPATRMGDIAVRRAQRYRSPHRVEHLRYPDAGHVGFGPPGTPVVTTAYHPLTGGFYAFGGTRAANARARADSWTRVLAFLTEALA